MSDSSSKRFFFYLSHPAHVHFFQAIIHRLASEHHKVFVAIRKKDITMELAEKCGLMPFVISKINPGKNLFGLGVELMITVLRFCVIVLKHDIHLSLAIGGESISLVKVLTARPCLAFTDTEHAIASNIFSFHLATKVYVPSCFFGKCTRNTVKYEGVHELAYLHPDIFQPDEKVLIKYGLTPGENFFVVRFVSWKAAHDIGQKGLSEEGKKQVLSFLLKKGKVLLSVEGRPEEWMKPYQVHFEIEDIHHLLYYAAGYVGEGATMATEAAILGTPSVFVNSLKMGSTNELSEKYNLMQLCENDQQVLDTIFGWKDIPVLKKQWADKRQSYLSSKINTQQFVLDQIKTHVSL